MCKIIFYLLQYRERRTHHITEECPVEVRPSVDPGVDLSRELVVEIYLMYYYGTLPSIPYDNMR